MGRATVNSGGYVISSLDMRGLKGETPCKRRRIAVESAKLSKCLGSKALGELIGSESGTLDLLAHHAMKAGHALHERFNVKKSAKGNICEISRGKTTFRGQGQVVYKVGQFALKNKEQA
ncbi:MAG: hypothetical protein ACI9WC_003017 [Arenicella sp.]|jgi:hypothetical protein